MSLSDLTKKLRRLYRAQDRLPKLIDDDSFEAQSLRDYYIKLRIVTRGEDSGLESVAMRDLFSARPTVDGNEAAKSARRVLITGGAGLGKSTLLHYMAFRWGLEAADGDDDESASHGLWHDRFDHVLKVPLKILASVGAKQRPSEALVELVREGLNAHDIYDPKGELYFEDDEVRSMLNCTQQQRERVLVVLDGFDEVAQEASKPAGIVRKVLEVIFAEFPNFVITTRPNAVELLSKSANIDREIENIGLGTDGVIRFIHRFFRGTAETEARGNGLVAFLRASPTVLDMCAIPINVALLCVVWTPEMEATFQRSFRILDLYEQVVLWLGRRYLRKAGRDVNEDTLAVDVMDAPVMRFLMRLALDGLCRGELRIGRDTLQRTKKNGGFVELEMRTVYEFGLLKPEGGGNPADAKKALPTASKSSLAADQRVHLFIHLSFQEYLAALLLQEKLRVENPAALCLATHVSSSSVPHMSDMPAYYVIEKNRSSARWLMTLKFLAAIVTREVKREIGGLPEETDVDDNTEAVEVELPKLSEETQRLCTVFWESVSCAEDGVLELGTTAAVTRLIHLLAQTDRRLRHIPNVDAMFDMIDKILKGRISTWSDEVIAAGYLTRPLAQYLSTNPTVPSAALVAYAFRRHPLMANEFLKSKRQYYTEALNSSAIFPSFSRVLQAELIEAASVLLQQGSGSDSVHICGQQDSDENPDLIGLLRDAAYNLIEREAKCVTYAANCLLFVMEHRPELRSASTLHQLWKSRLIGHYLDGVLLADDALQEDVISNPAEPLVPLVLDSDDDMQLGQVARTLPIVAVRVKKVRTTKARAALHRKISEMLLMSGESESVATAAEFIDPPAQLAFPDALLSVMKLAATYAQSPAAVPTPVAPSEAVTDNDDNDDDGSDDKNATHFGVETLKKHGYSPRLLPVMEAYKDAIKGSGKESYSLTYRTCLLSSLAVNHILPQELQAQMFPLTHIMSVTTLKQLMVDDKDEDVIIKSKYLQVIKVALAECIAKMLRAKFEGNSGAFVQYVAVLGEQCATQAISVFPSPIDTPFGGFCTTAVHCLVLLLLEKDRAVVSKVQEVLTDVLLRTSLLGNVHLHRADAPPQESGRGDPGSVAASRAADVLSLRDLYIAMPSELVRAEIVEWLVTLANRDHVVAVRLLLDCITPDAEDDLSICSKLLPRILSAIAACCGRAHGDKLSLAVVQHILRRMELTAAYFPDFACEVQSCAESVVVAASPSLSDDDLAALVELQGPSASAVQDALLSRLRDRSVDELKSLATADTSCDVVKSAAVVALLPHASAENGVVELVAKHQGLLESLKHHSWCFNSLIAHDGSEFDLNEVSDTVLKLGCNGTRSPWLTSTALLQLIDAQQHVNKLRVESLPAPRQEWVTANLVGHALQWAEPHLQRTGAAGPIILSSIRSRHGNPAEASRGLLEAVADFTKNLPTDGPAAFHVPFADSGSAPTGTEWGLRVVMTSCPLLSSSFEIALHSASSTQKCFESEPMFRTPIDAWKDGSGSCRYAATTILDAALDDVSITQPGLVAAFIESLCTFVEGTVHLGRLPPGGLLRGLRAVALELLLSTQLPLTRPVWVASLRESSRTSSPRLQSRIDSVLGSLAQLPGADGDSATTCCNQLLVELTRICQRYSAPETTRTALQLFQKFALSTYTRSFEKGSRSAFGKREVSDAFHLTRAPLTGRLMPVEDYLILTCTPVLSYDDGLSRTASSLFTAITKRFFTNSTSDDDDIDLPQFLMVIMFLMKAPNAKTTSILLQFMEAYTAEMTYGLSQLLMVTLAMFPVAGRIISRVVCRKQPRLIVDLLDSDDGGGFDALVQVTINAAAEVLNIKQTKSYVENVKSSMVMLALLRQVEKRTDKDSKQLQVNLSAFAELLAAHIDTAADDAWLTSERFEAIKTSCLSDTVKPIRLPALLGVRRALMARMLNDGVISDNELSLIEVFLASGQLKARLTRGGSLIVDETEYQLKPESFAKLLQSTQIKSLAKNAAQQLLPRVTRDRRTAATAIQFADNVIAPADGPRRLLEVGGAETITSLLHSDDVSGGTEVVVVELRTEFGDIAANVFYESPSGELVRQAEVLFHPMRTDAEDEALRRQLLLSTPLYTGGSDKEAMLREHVLRTFTSVTLEAVTCALAAAPDARSKLTERLPPRTADALGSRQVELIERMRGLLGAKAFADAEIHRVTAVDTLCLRDPALRAEIQLRGFGRRLQANEAAVQGLYSDLAKLSVSVEDAQRIVASLSTNMPNLDLLPRLLKREVDADNRDRDIKEMSPYRRALYREIRSQLNGVYVAAAAVSSGIVSNSRTNAAGAVGGALNAISSSIPIIGSAVGCLGAILQAADNAVQEELLRRYCTVAASTGEMDTIAEYVARKIAALPGVTPSTIDASLSASDRLSDKVAALKQRAVQYLSPPTTRPTGDEAQGRSDGGRVAALIVIKLQEGDAVPQQDDLVTKVTDFISSYFQLNLQPQNSVQGTQSPTPSPPNQPRSSHHPHDSQADTQQGGGCCAVM